MTHPFALPVLALFVLASTGAHAFKLAPWGASPPENSRAAPDRQVQPLMRHFTVDVHERITRHNLQPSHRRLEMDSHQVVSPHAAARVDITVQNEGSIFILRGRSDAGRDWIEEHCQEGDYNPFGEGARLVEHRYIGDIIEGAQADGLRVAAR